MTQADRCWPRGLATLLLLLLVAACGHAPAQALPAQLFFDDFSHADLAALRAAGWLLRDAAGHPGVPGAQWSPEAVRLIVDPDPARPGNRLLRLQAHTDGTPQGTVQAQLCHQRKVLGGTYAARIRFSDEPLSGADGDPVVQTFYAVAPLRFDFDPVFSEIDWEYLPNGGWGSAVTRLYSVAWQTVRIEPWQAHNVSTETAISLAGWHVLLVQVSPAQSRWFIDGVEVALHGGRNHPVVPMAISFNLWFSPAGLLPPSALPRVWVQDVDWVLHAADTLLSPAQVESTVAELRAFSRTLVDTVPAAAPALTSECRF